MDSESSDEEWVFSSSSEDQTKQKTTIRKFGKLSISEASKRTIRANIPKSSRLPSMENHTITPQLSPSPPPLLKEKEEEPSLQFISDEELSHICTDMNAKLLVFRVLQVYKSTEVFLQIRDIETDALSIESRLLSHLHLAAHPTEFIISTLYCLARHFADNKNSCLTPKFRKLLAQTFCTALGRFYRTPVEVQYEQEKANTEPDLISLEDDHKEEVDLISFEDIPHTNVVIQQEEEEEEEPDSNAEIVIDFTPIPPIAKYTLTLQDQIKLLSIIDTISSPVIIYYAMDVFRLVQLISFARDYEEYGVKLCKALMKHGHFDEYITCVKKLKLQPFFPTDVIANHLFNGGSGASLLPLTQGQPILQKEVLSFIDTQLRFYYAGNLGVVPTHHLKDLIEGSDVSQLSRLKDRKFQKDLLNSATKILKSLNIPQENYYFINLTQRYGCLRYLLIKRAIQQHEEGTFSIEASSNYNGLIDIVCQQSQELAKLAIKELVDMGDPLAAPYFAAKYGQQEFYCRYNSLPPIHRLLGLVKDEEINRPRNFTSQKKDKETPYYALPSHTNCMMIDSYDTLMYMKDILSASNICGIDTEWVPAFAAHSENVQTALMQISCDITGVIFLLDLKTILLPQNNHLLRVTEKVLQLFFEDTQLLKLAYDFSGDLDLLHSSIPSSKKWKIQKLLDFKSIRTMPDRTHKHGESIPGGLAGLVFHYLGVAVNKKQQISNWEQRPLTNEQVIYGACDAYCLLDVYYVLAQMQHPFIINHIPAETNSNPYL